MAEAENLDPRVPAIWRARFSGQERGDEFADKVLAIDHFREQVERDLAAADAADPLRVLLADEARAVETIRAALFEAELRGRNRARAVLAALREVANGAD